MILAVDRVLDVPYFPMTASTRARVLSATSGRPFNTFETVGTETPVSAAIRAMVTRASEGSSSSDFVVMKEILGHRNLI